MSYQLKNQEFVIFSSGALGNCAFLLHDNHQNDLKDFDEDDLKLYFENGCRIFTDRFKKFQSWERKVSADEEKELKFMIESLVHAKNNLYDTET